MRFLTSAADERKEWLVTEKDRLDREKVPALTDASAPFNARCTSSMETPIPDIRSGKSSTRISRLRPPTISVREMSGTSASRAITSSPMRRNWWSSYRSEKRVRLTMGTSSISTGLITQPRTMVGTLSAFMEILL